MNYPLKMILCETGKKCTVRHRLLHHLSINDRYHKQVFLLSSLLYNQHRSLTCH